METRFTIRGEAAELRWGYQQAAVLKGWTLTITPGKSDLTATVVERGFWTSDAALTFMVHRPTTEPWQWPVLSMDITGDTLTASVGPQE